MDNFGKNLKYEGRWRFGDYDKGIMNTSCNRYNRMGVMRGMGLVKDMMKNKKLNTIFNGILFVGVTVGNSFLENKDINIEEN